MAPKSQDSSSRPLSPVSCPRKQRLSKLAPQGHRYMTRSQTKTSSSRSTAKHSHVSPKVPSSESTAPFNSFHFPNPRVTVAFSDGDYDATAIQARFHPDPSGSSETPLDVEQITHVIRMSHLSARVPRRCFQRKYPPKLRHRYTNGLAWSDYDAKSGVATLDLVIPRDPPFLSSTTRLTEPQLLMAKDFLDLVLLSPQDPFNYPSYLKPRIAHPFHIFITAPFSEPSQMRKARKPSDSIGSAVPTTGDASLSPTSRDILALIQARIDPHSDVKTRDGLLILEEMIQTSINT